MPKTSPSHRTFWSPSWNAAAGIERATVAIAGMLLATSALSITLAPASEAEPPMPPLPAFESEPPAGLILEKPAVDEPVAEATATTNSAVGSEPPAPEPVAEIQLVAADVITAQAEGKDSLGKDRQEQRDKQEQKDRDAARNACGDQAKDCKQALKDLRDDGIETIALDIRVGGRPGSDYPCECRLEGETFQPRRFATTMMTWKAAGNCHKPLYFEDWNLERYGHSHGPLDPVFSAAHFFVTLPILPYKMGVFLV